MEFLETYCRKFVPLIVFGGSLEVNFMIDDNPKYAIESVGTRN